MLINLQIENIAVVERADIDFSAGFSVLSGETGAGKSIIIDALNAVIGGKRDGAANRFRSRFMPKGSYFPLSFRPAAIAIHNDGNMARDIIQVNIIICLLLFLSKPGHLHNPFCLTI